MFLAQSLDVNVYVCAGWWELSCGQEADRCVSRGITADTVLMHAHEEVKQH